MTHRVLVFLLFAIFLLRPSGAQPAVVPSAAGVDSILTARYESGAFHGAALVAQGDTVVYARGFGEANRKKGTPNTPDTQYLIGSLTKQFTAALVLTLVRDGLVRLDAPITRYLPNYTGEGGDRITIHHLLAHRSGLPSFADVRAAAGGSEEAVPLHGTPGTQYAYSNAGYILLGVIVEAVTEQSYAEALQARVLKPAGVVGDVGKPGGDHSAGQLATGYVDVWWKWGDQPADRVDPAGPFAAGMLSATPRALHRWTQALHDGRVLPGSLLTAMTTPYSDSGYGYGLFVEDIEIDGRTVTVTHHGGGINGFTAALRRLQWEEETAVTVVVLDNTQSETTVETAKTIARHFAQRL